MDNGKFVYSRPGEDGAVAEIPVSSYAYVLAEELLRRGGVRKPDNGSIAFIAGLALAEARGVEGIDVLDRDFVSKGELRREMLRHDLEFVTGGESGGEVAEAEENPTGTSGED